MKDKNHISYFKVENFKRFDSLEIRDIGQFNLILGDNNVGKTSILEALLYDSDRNAFVQNLIGALRFRNLKQNFIYQDIELYVNRERYINAKALSISFYFDEGGKEFLIIEIDKSNGKLLIRSNALTVAGQPNFGLREQAYLSGLHAIPFVPFYKGHDEDLTKFYSRLQQNRQLKAEFLKNLKILAPDILEIELSDPYSGERPHIIAYQEHTQASLPLALFGEGTIKLFRLLSEIVINRGKRLMIDEVDVGIHFSHFKEFWRIILKSAAANDVQLFMTTHNEECIKYFVEALNEMRELQGLARSIALVQNSKTREVKTFTYTFEQLEANVNIGNEIRG